MSSRLYVRARSENLHATTVVTVGRHHIPRIGRPNRNCSLNESRRIIASIVALISCRNDNCDACADCPANSCFLHHRPAFSAEAHAHHRWLLPIACYPIHGSDDPRDLPSAIVCQNLHRMDRRVLCNTVCSAPNGACGMRTVAVTICCASLIGGFAVLAEPVSIVKCRNGSPFEVVMR